MTATHSLNSTASASPVLYVAFELSNGQWKLASTTSRGQAARLVSVPARDQARALTEIARAKSRFGLPSNAAVFSCYEAGRDGFWLHRFLHQEGVNNVIVDSSSIEVNRRARRAKADGLDAVSLVGLLVRYCEGETGVWSAVEVPDPADEDQRQLHRELDELRRERTKHSNRVRGLLATIGIKITGKNALPCNLDLLRQWNGDPLPEGLKRRLTREFERMQLLDRQIRALEVEQAEQIQNDQTRHVEMVRMLMGLKGVGQTSATILVYEFFGWRRFANRRQVAALAGLTPTPYQGVPVTDAGRCTQGICRPELDVRTRRCKRQHARRCAGFRACLGTDLLLALQGFWPDGAHGDLADHVLLSADEHADLGHP